MPLVEWTDELSVRVAEIDAQHMHLISLLNRLYDAMKTGQPEPQLADLLDELFLYALQHFATEEKYMQQFGYPELAEHQAEHRQAAAHREAPALLLPPQSDGSGLTALHRPSPLQWHHDQWHRPGEIPAFLLYCRPARDR